MAANDVWTDFEVLRHNVKLHTVDRLKQILGGFNDECGTHFSKSGRKQDIIDRIVHTIDSWKQSNAVEKWLKAKAILYQVRNSGIYTPSRSSFTSSAGSITAPYASSSAVSRTSNYNISSSGLSSSGSSSALKASSNSKLGALVELQFKESPFFRVEDTVSSVLECPESQNAADRRQSVLQFTLKQDHVNKLKAADSKYHLRLFCTSSIFHSPGQAFRSFPSPCPIEFPPTCEVRVNAAQISASLKGLKKKPGTAPPPELDKYVNLNTSSNRVDMIYVNSQQPSQPKKFFLVVKLVESISVKSLVDSLKQDHFESSEKIKQQMQANTSEDDDIVAGPQKMSLKCPLTLARINTPCRSSNVNEQTTTWLCPVCEKTLEVHDLIIDGFSESILKDCPDSIDDVMVEADGEWHTSDNKYGSYHWKIKHPPKPSNASPPKPSSPIRAPLVPQILGLNGMPKTDEITVLDSDDEDEGRVKRELSPSVGNLSSTSMSHPHSEAVLPRPPAGDVIDLTIDSDDDDSPPPRSSEKRKASEAVSPTEGIWKKTRPNEGATSSRTNGDSYFRNSTHSAPANTARLPSLNQSPSNSPSLHSFANRPNSNGSPPVNEYSSSTHSRWN
ncbi:hypothetical protein D9757_005325 [Collybiopsis confluens]|uniref:PINIT domain-containing protein n=1 Tax=Collybiopsis confluens TaxID=2823264 RepID=A0A8H5HLR8_9AGAR|nr:hypothetical protein D9757_005325 [Collybiopsis confluens]